MAKVIEPAEIGKYIAKLQGDASLTAYAESLGIVRQIMQSVKAGKARPSPGVLFAIDLEVAYRNNATRHVYGAEQMPKQVEKIQQGASDSEFALTTGLTYPTVRVMKTPNYWAVCCNDFKQPVQPKTLAKIGFSLVYRTTKG